MGKPLDIGFEVVGTNNDPPGEGIGPGSRVGKIRNKDLLLMEEGG